MSDANRYDRLPEPPKPDSHADRAAYGPSLYSRDALLEYGLACYERAIEDQEVL
jgi:hypothetical protein